MSIPAAPEDETARFDDPDAVVSRSSWQFFPDGLLVFERVLGPSEPARLLVCFPEFCPDHACTCRGVLLRAVAHEVDSPPVGHESLRRLFDDGEARFFQIDLDFGFVDWPRGEDQRPPLEEEWLMFLRTHVDGVLLDSLNARWVKAKDVKEDRGWRSIDWSKRDPEEMVVWEELFPEDRVDHFLLDDRIFFASEHYCRKPGCSCAEARLVFTEIKADGKYRDVGSVRLDLSRGTVFEREVPRRNAAIFEELWTAFQKRHAVGDRMAKHNRRVQVIAPNLLGSPTAQPPSPPPSHLKAGRNDSCPCGSGKKFKRCCGR